jgi:NACalpha-BTF3-like transcription factor
MNYQITQEDIEILCSQTLISNETAKKLLKKNKGDIIKSILDIEQKNKNDTISNIVKDNISNIVKDNIEKDVNTKIKANLEEYRNIVDEKDIIYQKKQEEKEKKEQNENKGISDIHFCNEKKYFVKRQQEGQINIIHVL